LDGLNGLNGTNGSNGTNGTNGSNGTNGTNGLNGTNGTDGINGTFTDILNATQFNNASTEYSIDTTWLDTLFAPINYGDNWNKTYADTLYHDKLNAENYWNSTFATFNKTYADSLYTAFTWNKTYADSLYYAISNPSAFYNATTLPYQSSAVGFTNTTTIITTALQLNMTTGNITSVANNTGVVFGNGGASIIWNGTALILKVS